jgi:hypothetical protein
MPEPTRPLREIAREIARTWPRVNYAAAPYLRALHDLEGIDDAYGLDPAPEIVARFLCNAGTWRGEDARRIKAELRAILEGK